MRWIPCLLATFLLLALPGPRPAHAQFTPFSAQPLSTLTRESKIHARLLPDRTPLTAGQDVTLVLELAVDPGWHIQSARPHLPQLKATRITITDPAGLRLGPARYPVSRDIRAAGFDNLAAYEDTVYILIPVHVPADASPGSHQLSLTLQTQACDATSCLPPADTPLTLALTVAPPGTRSEPQHQDLLAKANAQPFYPDTALTTSAVSAPASPNTAAALEQLAQRPYRPANPADAPTALWQLALFALLGGAILNIMPCVLPVIPLKVLTLVQQAHGNRRDALAHGLVFSAGIITLFVALAAVLGSYRFFGGQNLYGKQYQNPAFMITMAYIVLALALSMLGVWTINPPRALYAADAPRTGYAGSFSMGVLATLLATPCSAPLLGPVLAWALVQPLPVTMLAFALVGVGMAVPYLILTAFPAALARLPRAGRWSELLKQALGIVMIGVALYLILQLKADLWPWALVGGLVLAAVCWAWGQIPTAAMATERIWQIRAVVVAVGLLLGLGLYHLAAPAAGPTQEQQAPDGWEPFSLDALDRGLAAGRPVVVDWTASWCINCRFVEATVLNSRPVTAAFARHNALLLRADITESNPVAETLLAKLGARAIPALAIFSPQRPHEPVVLRDLYSRQRVIAELGQAAPAHR